MFGFNYKKSVQALNYFAISAGGSMNKMKGLKLIWFSDRLHLRKYGRPILNDTYFALNYGPVASNTKDLIEDNDFLAPEEREYRNEYLANQDRYIYSSSNELDKKVFSKTDLEVMSIIQVEFGQLSEFQLSDESHKYPEWKKFEEQLKSKQSSRFKMNYDDFFLTSEQEHTALVMNEAYLQMSKDIFKDNGYIYQVL